MKKKLNPEVYRQGKRIDNLLLAVPDIRVMGLVMMYSIREDPTISSPAQIEESPFNLNIVL